jgi:Rieske Fe-S protein
VTNDRPALPAGTPDRVDPDDQQGLDRWCEHFGCTVQQLQEAVQAVGSDPAAVREHLLQQGSSAGAG